MDGAGSRLLDFWLHSGGKSVIIFHSGGPAILLLEGKANLEMVPDPEWCSGLGSSERVHRRVLLGLSLIEENAIQYGFSCGYMTSTAFPQVGT